MIRDNSRIEELLIKHLESGLVPSEQQELEEFLAGSPATRKLFDQINDADILNEKLKSFYAVPEKEMPRETDGSRRSVISALPFLNSILLRYAAMLLLIAGTATFLYQISKEQKDLPQAKSPGGTAIQPGGNKAILTLADGSTVTLDSRASGILASQGNTRIIRLASGGVAYHAGTTNEDVLYNTISTPRGGQYYAVLPDGSKVWLNAASSITFPTNFIGKERRVTIKGECYFEIAANRAMPFYAAAAGTEVQVLGTSFNINAYPDEDNVRTTLLEGSVQIRAREQLQILLPGQQSQTVAGRGIDVIANANVQKVMAWKNGLFDFEGATLQEVMRQIARWYDVEVVYEKQVPTLTFLGKMQRDFDLTEVLEVLKQTGVHYKLKERTIIILP